MILDYLSEQRRCLYRHLPSSRLWTCPSRGIVARLRPISGPRLLEAADRCVEFDAILSLPLCPVEGSIGCSKQFAPVVGRLELRHAEAACNSRNFAVAAQERTFCERGANAIGELSASDSVCAGQQKQELLAAPNVRRGRSRARCRCCRGSRRPNRSRVQGTPGSI